jgi:hypothetical protein
VGSFMIGFFSGSKGISIVTAWRGLPPKLFQQGRRHC